MEVVDLHADGHTIRALHIGEMPAGHIMILLEAKDSEKFPELFKLLRTALLDPKDVETLNTLSFGELCEVLDEWLRVKPYKITPDTSV